MAIRIPQNQIQFKYTSGKEYIDAVTYKEYQGHYYQLNNKFFAGKQFSTNAPEIIKSDSDKINLLILNPETSTYGKISKAKILNDKDKIVHLPSSNGPNTDKGGELFLSFFYQDLSFNPSILIRKTDENTYLKFQKNPLYKVTYVGTYKGKSQSIEDAERQIPGMTIFLGL